jgi:precorrin-3B synthase
MTMAQLPPTVKGWCPDAFHPMETGDGLLVRLRLAGGELAADTGAAIAGLARDYGNGLVDLTQRGNLQLRGVTPATLPDLTRALKALGLLEHDGLRHVICSPFHRLDVTAQIDGEALLRALEARLTAAPDLQNLPGKFCFLIDDGGRFGLDGVNADIRLLGHDKHVILALTGAEGISYPVGAFDLSSATDAAIALARAFIKLSAPTSARRMDRLVQSIGAKAIAKAAGFAPDAVLPPLPIRNTKAQDVIGVHIGFVGVAAPFGRFDAAQMEVLTSVATEGLRLTPWRVILLPGAKPTALQKLGRAGFIVSPQDARLVVAACPGQPACSSAQIDTRLAAQQLAGLVQQFAETGLALHVSGCSKGCAHAASAPVTLVGRDRAYDIVFDGRADAVPRLSGLTLPDLTAMLSAISAGRLAS